jgi:hypothetical protein
MQRSCSFDLAVKERSAMAGRLPAFWVEQKDNQGKLKQSVIKIWRQNIDISRRLHRSLLLRRTESISEVEPSTVSQFLECSPKQGDQTCFLLGILLDKRHRPGERGTVTTGS